MRQEDKIKEVAGKGSPFSVPDNYFETFKSNMMANLPEYPEKPLEQKLSVWHRIRPYVYLAAMFAGIWLMMTIFHRAGGIDGNTNTQSYPSDDAIALYTPDSYELYFGSDDDEDLEIEDEVTQLYTSIDDLKRDFYAAAIN